MASSEKVYVKAVMVDKKMGFWEMRPKSCPAYGHLKALGLKPWACVSGLTTNIQGPVPLRSCEHRQGDVQEDKDGAFFMCSFRAKERSPR